jgi:hypothetical protein
MENINTKTILSIEKKYIKILNRLALELQIPAIKIVPILIILLDRRETDINRVRELAFELTN